MINHYVHIMIFFGLFICGLVIDLKAIKREVYTFSFDECRLPILLVWLVLSLGVYFGRRICKQQVYLYMYVIGWLLAYLCSWVDIPAVWLSLGIIFFIGGLIADER